MTPRRPSSSQSGTRRVAGGARPRQVPAERAASAGGSGAGSSRSRSRGLPTAVPERTLPPRVVILAVVCLLAFVVIFTSLRAYLSQQAQYDAVVDRIKEASDTSTTLENELAQWKDDTYVRSQVRERLGYVMPGDTSYVVVGADSMKETEASGGATPGSPDAPWYEKLRDSSRAAGQTNGTAPAGTKGGADGKTLNPPPKELPTREPNQAPSDPPKTTPKPAVTPQTKETP